MIIAISGKNGSGKDLIGKVMLKVMSDYYSNNFEIKKFSQKVNDSYKIITGVDFLKINRSEKEIHREKFIKYAENVKKIFGENVWAKALLKDYSNNFTDNWIITDLRFQVEKNLIKNYTNVHFHVNDFKVGQKVRLLGFRNTTMDYGEIKKLNKETAFVSTIPGSFEMNYTDLTTVLDTDLVLNNNVEYITNIHNVDNEETLEKKIKEILFQLS